MPKLKTQAAKDGLLRRMRKQRLNYIAILPSLITLLNGIFGFGSVVLAAKGDYAMSAWALFMAMIADMLDGRVARMSKSTSSFGGQLDSLCDMISFGLAPAFLMLAILQTKIAPYLGSDLIFWNFLERFIWLAAATYISCAAIRLARFNVENEEDESAHMSFIGLPTPAAAGVIASLVIFHQERVMLLIQTTENNSFLRVIENSIIYALPFLLLGIALLMVSRIRYPHIVNQYAKGKKPFSHFIYILFLIGLIFFSMLQTALMLLFCGFAASGFAKWFFYKVLKRRRRLSPAPQSG